MKFLRFKHNDEVKLGIYSKDENMIIPIGSVLGDEDYDDMNRLIENITSDDINKLKEVYENNSGNNTIEIGEVKLLSPIERPIHDIICIGLNYSDHIGEVRGAGDDLDDNENIVYFSKRANRILGTEETVKGHFELDPEVDYEVELAVIIGKEGSNIPKEEVEDYIFGYSILNDLSSRGLQREHVQWYRGKSLDNYASMGPSILYKDEVEFPVELDVSSKVNGEIRQKSNTKLFINDIPSIIAEISNGITLEPGDIIATGTPSGVGAGFTPPKFLKSGDTVECEIEKIGKLINTIE